jgi:uncharacterized protein YifE (UPF0438 family)
MWKHLGRSVSIEDAKLLIGCIDGLCALDEGRRTPTTAAQEKFVAVCHDKAIPKTVYEKAYINWRFEKPDLLSIINEAENSERFTTAQNENSYELSDKTLKILGKKIAPEGLPPIFSQDDLIKAEKERQKRADKNQASDHKKANFKKLKVVEPWGDRSAWAKDTARNKFNGR